MKALTIAAALLLLGALAGCDTTQSEIDSMKRRAEIAKACKDSGGEWFNTPGWGEGCNFDTRRGKP